MAEFLSGIPYALLGCHIAAKFDYELIYGATFWPLIVLAEMNSSKEEEPTS